MLTRSQQNWSKQMDRHQSLCSHSSLQQDLADRGMANPVGPVLDHHTSKERQFAAVPELLNDQPHQPSKQSHAENHIEQIEAASGEDLAEKQASEQEGTQQIFNLRILHEKRLQHQQDLYHVFIDFKKAFKRVWHAALLATMKKYKISASLICDMKHLYDKATIAAAMTA